MKKIATIACLVLITMASAHAQKLTIDNVHKMDLRNASAIREGSEVKGYYFFYVSDKIDKRTNEYTLQITDENLTKLKDIKFQDSKDISIIESSFNGSDLIFLFYNEKDRTFEYQVFGADARKKFSYHRQLSKKEERYLEESYLSDDEDQTYKGIYPIDGKGFISNMPSREDKDFTFQIDFFSSEKRKQWTYIPTAGGKRFIGDYLGSYNGVVYIEVLKLTSALDQKPESYVIGLNLETGKQVFEKSTEKSKYKFYPASMSVLNNGKAYLFGEYFDPNGNIGKDKSLGFAFWEMDEKGNVISEKYNSWDLELGKFLSVSSKGKIDDFGFMFLHNIIQTADGSIFAVGEGYKKVASALGIISKIATRGGGGASVTKIKVTDMIMIKFDKDFNVKGATIYDKNSNNHEMPSGAAYVSTPLLGKLVKSYGGFDYSYMQWNKDYSSFTVCYSDYVRGKDYKGTTFNSLTYNEGKVSTDKINTKTKSTWSIVLPGRQGQVLLMDYYKKEKKLDAHVEKLN